MKNLRNCYAAFLLFALLFVSATAWAQTDLQQKLSQISDWYFSDQLQWLKVGTKSCWGLISSVGCVCLGMLFHSDKENQQLWISYHSHNKTSILLRYTFYDTYAIYI